MLQVALAPCAPFTVTKRLMVDSVGLAERFDCRLHTHLGETRDENEYCLAHFGCRPVDYLEECGWLTDRVWLAHGIHFNDDEVAPARPAPRRRLPLPDLEHDARLGPVPDEGAGGGGQPGRARRRRLGVERQLQPDGERAPRADDQPAHLRRGVGDPSRRLPLGDARARRAASAATTSARSRSASRPTSPSTRSTNCASPAPAIRSRRWCSAARTPPTG